MTERDPAAGDASARGGEDSGPRDELRIAHFTDLHITDPPAAMPWSALRGKGLVGWVNLRLLGRWSELSAAETVSEALVRDIVELAPDHVLFTGDATGLSLASEFERAHRVLAPLFEPPWAGRVTAVPGNHDVYTRAAARARLFERHFGTWMESDRPDPPPAVRFLGRSTALIALRDARPAAPWDSSGRLGPVQMRRLTELLAEPAVAVRRRIVALHYAPLLANGRSDTRLHGLRDAGDFLQTVDAAGVDLVVFGHIHRRFVLRRGAGGPAPLVTPGSATWRPGERAYHIYRVSASGVRIEARRYEERANAFVPWPDAPGIP